MSRQKRKIHANFLALEMHDVVAEKIILLDVVNPIQEGGIEIAFDTPVSKAERFHISFDLAELVRIAMSIKESES